MTEVNTAKIQENVVTKGIKKGAWLLTFLLMGTATLAYIDRQMFNLFVEAIKSDLNVSDTELGILQGLAFSLFYGTMSVPLARYADSHGRKKLITAAIFFWSIMTVATATSKSFFSMFLFRAGTASGEAGLAPSALSMLPDVFPKEKLAIPISIYTFSIYLGSGLAFIIGALVQVTFGDADSVVVPFLGETKVWRVAFIIAGCIGLPWLLILWKFLKEPARMQYNADGTSVEVASNAAPVAEIWMHIKGHIGFYGPFFVGFTLVLGSLNGVWTWTPTILIRIFDMSVEEVGSLYGLIFFVCGITGALFFGWLSAKITSAGHQGGILKVSIIAIIGLILSQLFASVADNAFWALVTAGASVFFIAPCISLPPAVLQTIAPTNMRAQISAAFLMITGVFGLGMGPILVGVWTDFIFNDPMRLHHAVAGSVVVLSAISIPLIFIAKRNFIKIIRE